MSDSALEIRLIDDSPEAQAAFRGDTAASNIAGDRSSNVSGQSLNQEKVALTTSFDKFSSTMEQILNEFRNKNAAEVNKRLSDSRSSETAKKQQDGKQGTETNQGMISQLLDGIKRTRVGQSVSNVFQRARRSKSGRAVARFGRRTAIRARALASRVTSSQAFQRTRAVAGRAATGIASRVARSRVGGLAGGAVGRVATGAAARVAGGGAASGASAGVAAGGVGLAGAAAIAAPIVILTGTVLGLAAATKALASAAEDLTDYSGTLSRLEGERQIQSELNRIDRAKQLEPALGQVQGARNRLDDAQEKFYTAVLVFLAKFAPAIEAGVDTLSAIFKLGELGLATVDLGVAKLTLTNQEDDVTAQAKFDKTLEEFTKAIAEIATEDKAENGGLLDPDFKAIIEFHTNEGKTVPKINAGKLP